MTESVGIDLIPRYPEIVRGAHNIYQSSAPALAAFVVGTGAVNYLLDQKSGTLYIDTVHGVVVVGYGKWVIRQADRTVEVLNDIEVMERYLPVDEEAALAYVGGSGWGAPITDITPRRVVAS